MPDNLSKMPRMLTIYNVPLDQYIVKSTSFLKYKDIGTKYSVEVFCIENVKDLLATKEGNYINSFLRLCHEEHKICILLE